MNDIEIFKILEDIIKGDEDCIKTISCGLNNQKNDEDVEHYKREIEAITNIVNLYKKEKARADKLEKEYSQMLTKIDNLEQIEQEHKEENGRLREENEVLRYGLRENKILRHGLEENTEEIDKLYKIINLMAEELADWYMDNRIDNRKIDKQYVINKFTNKI